MPRLLLGARARPARSRRRRVGHGRVELSYEGPNGFAVSAGVQSCGEGAHLDQSEISKDIKCTSSADPSPFPIFELSYVVGLMGITLPRLPRVLSLCQLLDLASRPTPP